MRRQVNGRRPRPFVVFVVAVAAATFLAACGSDDDNSEGGSSDTTTAATTPQSTELGEGVSADAVKVGFVLIDYDNDVISANIDFNRGDQEAIYRAFIDNINNNGGVAGGKKIDPTFEIYAPLGSDPPLQACTKLTEDTGVYAVIGVLYEPSGAAQSCVTKDHERVLITHELSQSMMDDAPPGLLLTTDTLAERSATTMLDSAKEKGLLDGKKFGYLSDQETQGRIDDIIQPKVEELGLESGTAGTVQLDTSGDTSAAQAQLDGFMERWQSEGVNAIFLSGLKVVDNNFVSKIRDTMGPDVLMFTDGDASAKGNAQDQKIAGVTPNPYDGMYAMIGLSDQEQFESPGMQECVKIWEDKSGTKVTAPKDVVPDSNGKRSEIWITVRDACTETNFFKDIADKVGQYLNNDNWTAAVNTFGPIEVAGATAATLGEGKYDAGDSATIAIWDSTQGNGDWKKLP
jgi:hypothetical protein